MQISQFDAQNPLIILDMANNHNGLVSHGKSIIKELREATAESPFSVAVKFQYRDLDSFIHQDFRDRMDMKYINRFQSTRLSWRDFAELTEFAKACGFLTSATPFDESSVGWVKAHGHDFLKVASASFTDWPLWDAIAETDLPIVASTAGAAINEIDRVVSFLRNRNRDFILMHCVAAYPTRDEDLKLSRIQVLRRRYNDVPIGYSTHEDPENLTAGPLALAEGACALERHVGEATTSSPLNAYSSDAEGISAWMASLAAAISMIGTDGDAQTPNPAEAEALRGLGRGVYLKKDVDAQRAITNDDVYFAIPLQHGQLSASDWSKYVSVVARTNLGAHQPLTEGTVAKTDGHEQVLAAVRQIASLLSDSGAVVPSGAELEVSHHYGLDRFHEFGLGMITVVNRDYCKKLLIVLPGQEHPEQWHKIKEESFMLLHGDLELWLDGDFTAVKEGDFITVAAGVRHRFRSTGGAVIEELSSTHVPNDSYYTDQTIMNNPNRKSFIRFWGAV